MIFMIEHVHKLKPPHPDVDCVILFQCRGMLLYHYYGLGELITTDAQIIRFYTDPMEDHLERFLREMQRAIDEERLLAILHYMKFRLN